MDEIRYMWQVQYRDAMLETNPAKLHELVMAAEGAIFERMLEVSGSEDGYEERQAIQDACNGLLVIKREILKWPISAASTNGSHAAPQSDEQGD